MTENEVNIMKMFEQAKNMADIINLNNNSSNNQNMQKMMKTVEIANSINSVLNYDPDSEQEDINDKESNMLEEYSHDYIINNLESPGLKSLKSLLPYIELKYRKNLAIFIKLMEIQNLLDAYSQAIVNMQENTKLDWRKGMLKSMRPYMNDDRKETIDMCIKILDIKTILEEYKTLNDNTMVLENKPDSYDQNNYKIYENEFI